MKYVKGQILDHNGQPIQKPGIIYLQSVDRSFTTDPVQILDSNFDAWTDASPQLVQLVVKYPGYQVARINFADLPEASQADTFIQLKKFPYALVLAAVALVYYLAKQNKKVGALEAKDVLPYVIIAAAIFGFGLLDDILEALGIRASDQTKDLDQAAQDPYTFWSPNFWRNKPGTSPWTYTINYETAKQYAKELWNSAGAVNDCESCMIAVFRRLRTQANASYLAEVFSLEYGKDLLTWLRGGLWPDDRLSDADVYTINSYLTALPKY